MVELAQVAISSAMHNPLTGAHKIPQQLCPVEMYAPSTPGIAPITGNPSAVQGRMQACTRSGVRLPIAEDMPASDVMAALTRAGFSLMSSEDAQSPPARRRSPET